jgi:hypothetical protein
MKNVTGLTHRLKSEIASLSSSTLEDPGNGITHGRDGDWLVSDVETFTSKRDSTQIVVCYCTYAPITPQWEAIERGASVEDLVTA